MSSSTPRNPAHPSGTGAGNQPRLPVNQPRPPVDQTRRAGDQTAPGTQTRPPVKQTRRAGDQTGSAAANQTRPAGNQGGANPSSVQAASRNATSQADSTGQRRQPSRQNTMSGPPSFSIPKFEGKDEKFSHYYKEVQKLLKDRQDNGVSKPRILVFSDAEQDYDDTLATIFLAEMHRLGVVELVGIVANHHPTEKRAKYLRTLLQLLDLPNVPVARGSNGTDDLKAHAQDYYYGLKNKTFEKASWNDDGFPGLEKIINGADVDHKGPLTSLVISSLQDMGEWFDGHKKEPQVIKKTFARCISQGGYVVSEKGRTVELEPDMGMMNNKFHRKQTENYHERLVQYELPSDAWSREVAADSKLPGDFMRKLFKYGPIGAHFEWMWMRLEFKFFWDPFNWRFSETCDEEWWFKRRLGVDEAEAKKLKEQGNVPFDLLSTRIKVVAYDCCAAAGSAGDDFLRAMGVMDAKLPGYNDRTWHKHRVFGRAKDDLGGIDGKVLREVMEAFILGGLMSTARAACAKINPNTIEYHRVEYDYDADFFVKTLLGPLKEEAKHKGMAKSLSDQVDAIKAKAKKNKVALTPEENEKIRVLEEQAAHQERLAGAVRLELRKIKGVKPGYGPTRADIPYEQLYQKEMKKIEQHEQQQASQPAKQQAGQPAKQQASQPAKQQASQPAKQQVSHPAKQHASQPATPQTKGKRQGTPASG